MNGTTQAVKVYKTSIIPQGGHIEPIREAKVVLPTIGVEVIHLVVFFSVISFIFGGLWKAAVLAGKKAEATSAATSTVSQ